MSPPREDSLAALNLIASRLEALDEKMDGQHARLRADLHAALDRIREEMHALRDDQAAIALDVNTLKAQRDFDERQSIRRGAWAGIIAGFGFSALMWVADHLWRKGP